MSVKSGYGTITGVVDDTTNTNLTIVLPSKQTKRILNIDCGYSIVQGGGNTALTLGRLIIAGTNFDATTEFVDPTINALPASLQGIQIFFDMPITAIDATQIGIQHSFSWAQGIQIPDGVDASIILTACFGNGNAPPVADPVNAFLHVQGLSAGSDKIFKNV